MSDDDFLVEDEPVEAIEAAFAAGRRVVTSRPEPPLAATQARTLAFILKRTRDGQFRFDLMSGSGEVIATSESYPTKAAALQGIESVKRNAAGAAVEYDTV
ncbi:MAG: YegP family protein [Frankiaceae bacterium]|nr:YegP family protein [Frankiaceae bacterium]